MKKGQWINIFVRDILLAIVIAYLNWTLNYQLWIGGVLMGMMFVLVSWHISGLLKQRRFEEKLHS